MFKYYMIRILTRPVFYICIGCLVAIMLFDVRTDFPHASDSILNLMYFYLFGVNAHYVTVVPIATSIPFLLCFVEELNRKTKLYQMVRIQYRSYFNGIFGSAVVSSALVAGLSVTVYLLICKCAGAGLLTGQQVYDETIYSGLMELTQIIGILLMSCLGCVCFGMLWPLFGLVLSIFTRNRYVLYAAPFVIFFGWNYMTSYISVEIPIIRYWNPMNLLTYILIYDSTMTVLKLLIYILLFTVIVTSVLYVVYYGISMRKMIKNGG